MIFGLSIFLHEGNANILETRHLNNSKPFNDFLKKKFIFRTFHWLKCYIYLVLFHICLHCCTSLYCVVVDFKVLRLSDTKWLVMAF